MALVTKTRERHDIPHEEGEWFEFQQLTGAQLDAAERANTKTVLGTIGDFSDEVIARINKRNEEANAAAAEIGEVRRVYDKDVLIKYGVVGWSYEEPCNNASKELLDAPTRDWAAEIIYGMNTRTEGEPKAS